MIALQIIDSCAKREQFSSSKCLLHKLLLFANLLTVESSPLNSTRLRAETNDFLVRYPLSLRLISVANIIDLAEGKKRKANEEECTVELRCFDGEAH